jgi:hypothetical protein
MGLYQIKKLLHIKGSNYQSKEITGWEKSLASYSPDEGLICRIYKELKKINHRKNNPINKWANEPDSSQKYKWLIHKEIFSVLSHKEMQIKITLRFPLTPVRMAITIIKKTNVCWQGC